MEYENCNYQIERLNYVLSIEDKETNGMAMALKLITRAGEGYA